MENNVDMIQVDDLHKRLNAINTLIVKNKYLKCTAFALCVLSSISAARTTFGVARSYVQYIIWSIKYSTSMSDALWYARTSTSGTMSSSLFGIVPWILVSALILTAVAILVDGTDLMTSEMTFIINRVEQFIDIEYKNNMKDNKFNLPGGIIVNHRISFEDIQHIRIDKSEKRITITGLIQTLQNGYVQQDNTSYAVSNEKQTNKYRTVSFIVTKEAIEEFENSIREIKEVEIVNDYTN